MKKILLLTDFSENAKSAIYYALSLFGEDGVIFQIVHGMYLPYHKPNAPASVTDVRTELARTSFEKLLSDINSDFPENRFLVQTEIWAGEIVGITAKLVSEDKTDLIVMGSRGVSGIAEVLMGTNTIAVMEQVHCPVLAVPVNYIFKKPEKIVMAMDQGEGPSSQVMKPLVRFAEKYNARVLVIHVSKDKSQQEEVNYDKVNKCLENVRSHCLTIYDEDIAHGLGGFVKKEKVEMLAMIKQKLNFFERVFHRSLSNQMVLQTDVPMLVMSYKK